MKLSDIETYGRRAKGQVELIKFVQGEELTRGEAMLAKCYECSEGYADGVGDCKMKSCPLYGHMPYNKSKPKKVMSEEQKNTLRERLKKARLCV